MGSGAHGGKCDHQAAGSGLSSNLVKEPSQPHSSLDDAGWAALLERTPEPHRDRLDLKAQRFNDAEFERASPMRDALMRMLIT